jgi:protein-S-isoprenylcysteine O-methyltransferase Ste14
VLVGGSIEGEEDPVTEQVGRGAGLAIGIVVLALVIAPLNYTQLPDGVPKDFPRTIAAAIIAALIAIIVAVLAAFAGDTGRLKNIGSAVTPIAILAFGLLIVGIVVERLVQDPNQKDAVEAIGVIAVALLGFVFLFTSGAPQLSWSNLPIVASVAALLVVVAYAATIVWMATVATDATDKTWGRYLVLFAAVQGVGLAAVGALLGAQVKQGEVDTQKDLTKTAVAAGKTLQQKVDQTKPDPTDVEMNRALDDLAKVSLLVQ